MVAAAATLAAGAAAAAAGADSKTIGVFNYKGGVGKTTIAIDLAAALASNGSKVCLLDLDQQANTSDFFEDGDTPKY
jgi:chromosome partitioning protein